MNFILNFVHEIREKFLHEFAREFAHEFVHEFMREYYIFKERIWEKSISIVFFYQRIKIQKHKKLHVTEAI